MWNATTITYSIWNWKLQCGLYDVPSPVHVNKCMNARMHCIRYANFEYALIYHHKQVNKREERSGGWKTYTHSPTLITIAPSLGGTKIIIQSQNKWINITNSNYWINKCEIKGGHSPSPRDVRMMHARCPPCPGTRTMPLFPLLLLPCLSGKLPESWDTFHIPWILPPAEGLDHRLQGLATGCNWDYRHKKCAGRHWRVPVGTKFLQETVLTAADSNRAWYGILGQMYARTHSLSCNGLKGAWPSTPGPPITHFNAWWPKKPKCATSMWNEMHINKQRAQPLSYSIQEVKHACQMQPKHAI